MELGGLSRSGSIFLISNYIVSTSRKGATLNLTMKRPSASSNFSERWVSLDI